MPGNCLTNCFTSRFKHRSSTTLFDVTLSNTTSTFRAADALDAAQPPSPALESQTTGPVVQHAEEGTESPHFEPAPQPPTPPLPPVPPVPPAHPRPPAPEIVPAGNLVLTLDGAGEYNGAGQIPLPAIIEASEPKLSEETEASVRGGYLPSTDELDPAPPYSASQPSFLLPTLARSIYYCSECRQRFETGRLLRFHAQWCVGPEIAGRPFKCSNCSHTFDRGDLLRLHSGECFGPEIAGRPYKCDKCCYTLDKGDLSELHSQKCVGHGGAFINAGPFRPNPNITCIMAKMGHKEGEGLRKDGTGRTTPVETTVLRRGVGLGHVQDLPSTDITCPPPAHLRAKSDNELDDLVPVPRSAAPPVPEVAPTINSIPNLDGPAVSTSQHGSSINAMIPAKNTVLRFPCPRCAKSYFHAKQLRRHLLRHGGDIPYMCILCGQKSLSQDIYTRHLHRCAESKVEHEEERGQAVMALSPRSGMEPRMPILMSPADMALPSSSFSEEAFSPDTVAPGIIMTPPSDSGSGAQLSENTASVSHELPNASNRIILTGWPWSRPGGRRQLYFAYGSNLSTSQMSHRCPSSYLHRSPLAVLGGWEWFIAARGHPSIPRVEGVEDKEAQARILKENKVSGLLYSLDIYSEWKVDHAEGVGEGKTGSYYKEAFEVELLLPDGTRDPQPQTVWCFTYIDCCGDEDKGIRDEYKRRLKRVMIESERLGLSVGGIFGEWQIEVNEAESGPKAETSLRGGKRAKSLVRNLKRKVSCEGSDDCKEGCEYVPVEAS